MDINFICGLLTHTHTATHTLWVFCSFVSKTWCSDLPSCYLQPTVSSHYNTTQSPINFSQILVMWTCFSEHCTAKFQHAIGSLMKIILYCHFSSAAACLLFSERSERVLYVSAVNTDRQSMTWQVHNVRTVDFISITRFLFLLYFWFCQWCRLNGFFLQASKTFWKDE